MLKLYEFRDKFLRFIGLAGLIVVSIIAVLVWQGWSITIKPPLECWGSKEAFFPQAHNYWEIAQKAFPKSDPRTVSEELVRMNGKIYYGGTIKIPLGCRNR